jgi:hypothetical protein
MEHNKAVAKLGISKQYVVAALIPFAHKAHVSCPAALKELLLLIDPHDAMGSCCSCFP